MNKTPDASMIAGYIRGHGGIEAARAQAKENLVIAAQTDRMRAVTFWAAVVNGIDALGNEDPRVLELLLSPVAA